jgi:glycosyltransferase involved in cell wall biosynthesis
MKTWNVDLVHAHEARSHALAMIALIGRKEIPLIVTRRVAFTPKSVRLKYGERVTRFIAISRAVRDAMVGAGVDTSRIDVVHSGIARQSETIRPRDWRSELGWPPDSVLCGVVGAMTGEKGIESLAAIVKSLPPSARKRTRIVLLGGSARGDTEIEGVPTHHAGFVTDIEQGIAGLDILWHPSRSEGLGTSVIDAMALGVPPIAFNVGGIPEVIEDGVSGKLVTAGDAGHFGLAAAELIENPALRAKLATAARQRAKTFDAGEMTKQTEAVYNDVLSG